MRRAVRSLIFFDPVEKLQPWAERHRRTAYLPIVSEGHGRPAGSRFNGSPFLVDGEDWPACQICAKAMPLFLQLDLDALPEAYSGRFGSGILQLFYCADASAHQDSETDEAFQHASKLVRVVPPNAAGALAAPRDVGLEAKPLAIIGWGGKDECCNAKEARDHGIDWRRESLSGGRHRTRFVCEALGVDTGWIERTEHEHAVHEKVFSPSSGDKLGGWPRWIQGVEYPSCPQCGARMALVFQIDSEDHVPYIFGYGGCGHITQCPTHKDVVTFAWAGA